MGRKIEVGKAGSWRGCEGILRGFGWKGLHQVTREGCGLEANHSREVGQGASPPSPGVGTQEHYLRSGRDRKLEVTLEEINHNQADPRGR